MKSNVIPGTPDASEYAPYFHQYLRFASDEQDIAAALTGQVDLLRQLLQRAEPGELTRLHEPYTWTITQVIGHLVDQERIFGNRIARFASGDPTELPGYDQNLIADNAGYECCAATDLLEELDCLRRGNLWMFSRLTPEQWDRRGTAEGKVLSVRAGAYLLAGHLIYHLNILKNRLGD